MAQIGIQIEPQFGFTYGEIRDLALLCESAGFNSLWCSDHFFLDAKSEERNSWDCNSSEGIDWAQLRQYSTSVEQWRFSQGQ